MKKAASAAICLILSVIMMIPVSASGVSLKLDGKDEGNEWYPYLDTYTSLLSSSDSSNNIESAGVKYAFDTSKSCVWYFFSFRCKKSPDDMSLSGIKLKIEGSEAIILKIGDSKEAQTDYVNDDYSVSLYMAQQRDNSVNCEVKAVIKNGVGSSTSFSAAFYDDTGTLSVNKTKVITNPDYTTTQTETEKTTKTTTSKTTTTKTTTTKASTAKTTTSSGRTRRATTTYRSRVTTKAPQTTEKQTAEKTTRTATTKAKTTKEKTAKSEADSYQPELITSADEDSAASESTSSGISATVIEKGSESLTSAYKIAAGIGAAVLFAVVGVWAVRSRNDASRADKEEKESPPVETEDKENKEDKK